MKNKRQQVKHRFSETFLAAYDREPIELGVLVYASREKLVSRCLQKLVCHDQEDVERCLARCRVALGPTETSGAVLRRGFRKSYP